VAYRKMEDTNLCWSAYGRNGGPVHREGCGVPQNGTPRATVHPSSTASLQPPWATVHPPSTSSSLHLLLFIHRRLPPASSSYYSPRAPIHPASTGYYSTSPLHGVLFNHPSTGYCSSSPPPATVQPALHRLLFIQPSTGSCSSNHNRLDRGPVHPPATASTTTGSCSSNPHRELFIQPPTILTIHQEAAGSIGLS